MCLNCYEAYFCCFRGVIVLKPNEIYFMRPLKVRQDNTQVRYGSYVCSIFISKSEFVNTPFDDLILMGLRRLPKQLQQLSMWWSSCCTPWLFISHDVCHSISTLFGLCLRSIHVVHPLHPPIIHLIRFLFHRSRLSQSASKINWKFWTLRVFEWTSWLKCANQLFVTRFE